jgi:hypothetical protein
VDWGPTWTPIGASDPTPNDTLRSGKLIPPDWGDRAICLTRSPETAAYFALMVGPEIDQWSGAVLVLNRGSLGQRYRLEPCQYMDDRDEREERIYDRAICFRRHLIGVVREADVAKILGPPKQAELKVGRAPVPRQLVRDPDPMLRKNIPAPWSCQPHARR